MAFAEVALAQIKSLRQTAVPRNYEIWYVYATGYNAPLNKIINETLARNGRLTEADLEQIYETYLSHIKTTDRIDKVGARVIGEIDDVMTLIEDALGMSASYDDTLSGATEKLAVAQNRDQVKTIIDSLMKSTREMRETNKALQDRLTLSKSEIGDLQQSLEAIRAESLTDPLTGLGNRKYFDRFFFSSRRRHTRFDCDWSSDVCSSDLASRSSAPAMCNASSRRPASAIASAANPVEKALLLTSASPSPAASRVPRKRWCAMSAFGARSLWPTDPSR